jgi:hypothetical protein
MIVNLISILPSYLSLLISGTQYLLIIRLLFKQSLKFRFGRWV